MGSTADGPSTSEPTYTATEEYVSRQVNLPLPVVSTIYRAGHLWPVSLNDFDRLAQQEATALNCSLN
jgi:hypothetical protein